MGISGDSHLSLFLGRRSSREKTRHPLSEKEKRNFSFLEITRALTTTMAFSTPHAHASRRRRRNVRLRGI